MQINYKLVNYKHFPTATDETETNYKTRSLPHWGKSKQRTVTQADDISNLYVTVCKTEE